MADETLNGANGENGANEASETSETKKASGAGKGNETSEATSKSQSESQNELKEPKNWDEIQSQDKQTAEKSAELKNKAEFKGSADLKNKAEFKDSFDFKDRDEFKDIKRKNGKFLPNDEQLRMLVKYEEIKLNEIDTSEITDMSHLFASFPFDLYKEEDVKNLNIGNSQRQDFSGIGEWDTSKVETFEGMFKFCAQFNEDISEWDTSSAKSFQAMFNKASRFNQPIGKWNTSNVTDMGHMFGATNFNQPLDEWDTSKVTNMSGMFIGAQNFNQSLNKWKVLNVTNMRVMFMGAENFNQPLDKWDISNVEDMSSMFEKANSFNQDLSAWGDKLGKVQDASLMFSRAKALKLDFLNSWKLCADCDTYFMTKMEGVSWDELKDSYEVKHIKRNKKGQFVPKNKQLKMLVKYEEVKLYEIDTSEVTSMKYLFNRLNLDSPQWVISFIALPKFFPYKNFREDFSGIDKWDTSKVTTFESMFIDVRNFNEDIGGWDTSSAQNFSYMFFGAKKFNQNINDWDVSKVSDFSYMFSLTIDLINLWINGMFQMPLK